MLKPIKISIDTLNDSTVANYNNIRKGDTLSMTINIFQNSASLNLSGQTMHIVLQKPDGYTVEKVVNSVTGSSFVVNFDVQATLGIGDVEGIVEISDTNGTNITNTFTFEVKPNPSDNIVIKSSNEIETLQQIIGLIAEYNGNADNLAIQNNIALQRINTLENDISTGNALHSNLQNDINTGNSLHTTLQSDISTGNALDAVLKEDISNGNLTHNNLLASIINGNEVIEGLNIANWAEIQSFISIMNIVLANIPLTSEFDIELTDENDIVLTL